MPMLTGPSLTISRQLSEVESMVARAAWQEVRATLNADREGAARTPELALFFAESLLRCGAPAEAFAWLELRLSFLSRSANRRAWMRGLNLAGAAALETGRIAEAAEYFSKAHELAAARGDHLLSARATNNLALVASARGDWDAAMAYYTLAIPAYQRVGSVRGLAECYHNMATTLMEAGELDRAEDAERQAVEFARDVFSTRLHAYVMAGRADILLRKGDFVLSEALALRAVAEFTLLDDAAGRAHALRIVGLCRLGRNETREAEQTLCSAVDFAVVAGVVRILGDCRLGRARARLVLGDTAGASDDLEQACLMFEQLGSTDKVRVVRELQSALAIRGQGPASFSH